MIIYILLVLNVTYFYLNNSDAKGSYNKICKHQKHVNIKVYYGTKELCKCTYLVRTVECKYSGTVVKEDREPPVTYPFVRGALISYLSKIFFIAL